MNSTVETAAAAIIAPRILKGFRLHWLLYGAAAYYGLRLMSKRGIFPKQADAALDVIDRGIDAAKSSIGFGKGESEVALSHH